MQNQNNDLKRYESDLITAGESLRKYWQKRFVRREDAEDAAQEGVLMGLLKADKYRGDNNSTARTFLITVGKNAGREYFERENRFHRNCEAYQQEHRPSQRRNGVTVRRFKP